MRIADWNLNVEMNEGMGCKRARIKVCGIYKVVTYTVACLGPLGTIDATEKPRMSCDF